VLRCRCCIVLVLLAVTLAAQEMPKDQPPLTAVVKDIQHAAGASTLGTVARWLASLQAYLSGPDQGGIRHGRQLHLEGLQPHDAVLFCNLTRSYISYLLAEYEHLTSASARLR